MKKLIQIILAVVALGAAAVGAFWLFKGEELQQEYAAYKRTGAPILMYHGVGYETGPDWPRSLVMRPEVFEEQLAYLAQAGYKLITVEDLAAKLTAGEDVSGYMGLTFDDGYKNNYTVVLPLLEKYGAKGTFFVINKEIGSPTHMNETEIKALMKAGMELGSHTTSHVPLATIEEKYYAWELATSRFYLKKNFDRYIVRTLAYPNGSYNQQIIEAAQKYGFYRAVTGHIGLNTSVTYKAAPMEMYRVTVTDDGKGLEGFRSRLEQAYFFGFLQTKGLDINWLRDLFLR